VAKVLRSDRVRVIELGPHERAVTGQPPPTEAEAARLWRDGAHIDFQVGLGRIVALHHRSSTSYKIH
jgi:hypothetical protein